MHELYLHWLACKGVWTKSSICIKIFKKNTSEEQQQYSFVTRTTLVELYGEKLADDLIERHKDAESKLPANKKNTFIKRQPSLYICHLGVPLKVADPMNWCSFLFIRIILTPIQPIETDIPVVQEPRLPRERRSLSVQGLHRHCGEEERDQGYLC